jgi:hypothetical protein
MQLDESNANRLVLRSITAETAGRFRCEVSAEAPSFETVSGHADMTVVRKCRYFVLFFIALFLCTIRFFFLFFLFFSLLHQCAHYRPLSLTSSFMSSRFFCSAIRPPPLSRHLPLPFFLSRCIDVCCFISVSIPRLFITMGPLIYPTTSSSRAHGSNS